MKNIHGGWGGIILAADEKNFNALKKFSEVLDKNISPNLKNLVYFADQFDTEESLMSCADFYIANRDTKTIFRSELADDYNVVILSAVDNNIF